MNSNEVTVTTYSLTASNGKHIRTATRVTYRGQTVEFMERMSKREAIRQATRHFA